MCHAVAVVGVVVGFYVISVGSEAASARLCYGIVLCAFRDGCKSL